MDIREDSARVKAILKKIIKKVVDEECKPCFRVYKAKVVEAPNGQTCTVKILGDNNTMALPYSSKVSAVVENDFVWVATIYNNFSNAIVWETIDFN